MWNDLLYVINLQMNIKKTIVIILVFLTITAQSKAQKMNLETDSTAKCYSTAEIKINTSKQHVFEILSDINHWPDWQTSVTKAEIKGRPENGKKFKWKAGGLRIHSKLHTVNPNSEIGWTGKIWWIKAVHNWYITEENGQTKVIVQETLKGFGSSGMKKSLQEGMKKNLAELKAKAERI